MAARPPSCSSFQASQPPTLRPSRFFLLFSRFGSSLRFDALRCCFFVFVVRFRRSLDARPTPWRRSPSKLPGLRTPQAPQRRNVRPMSSSTKSAKLRVLPSRSSSSCCSCSCSCSCFCSFFVFVPAAQADESDAPLGAAPPRRARKGRISNPPQSAPGAKPSVPRAFLFAALKTILDRAGDDNLSKGLIDPFG